MEKRYRVLRFIAGLYQVLGVLMPILVIAGYFFFARAYSVSDGIRTDDPNWLSGLITVIIPALLSGIFLFGFGQLIMVLIHIEENTRRTSLLLGRRTRSS
jgi:predicted ferric reductase